MKINRKVFGHDKNRARQMYAPGTPAFEVAELVYELFLELTQVPYSAMNRAYSRAEREKNPKLEYLWSSGHAQAKEFLTRYKNVVRDSIVPLAKLTKHRQAYDDSQDRHTQEFKQLIVDGQFYMLHEKLRDFAPMLLPEDHLEAYYKVLDTTYESVKTRLLEALSYFEAEGKFTEQDFEGVQ